MDRVTHLLLTLFGQDAEVIIGEDGDPVGVRLTIRFDRRTSGLQDALKLLDGDAEGLDVAEQRGAPTKGAGGF